MQARCRLDDNVRASSLPHSAPLMPTSFAQIRLPLLAVVLASGLAGCASTPPPTGDLSAAQQAVMRADDADADQYAPQDLAAARSASAAPRPRCRRARTRTPGVWR
ncbi:hypothetical protein [Lysobacter gummosus]|uniref:hypothetical protein n=1 Tax=Lysobacter gummosus TaxID=262324 RepID=UPI00363EE6E0